MSYTEVHMPVSDFAKNLSFAYFETYSFQRGAKLLELFRNPSNFKGHDFYPVFLTKLDGSLDITSTLTNTIQATDSRVQALIEILSIPTVNQYHWMCRPTYRDGIIFYDADGNRVAILNICLGCDYLQLADETYLDADNTTYKRLKEWFIDLGHDVDDEDSKGLTSRLVIRSIPFAYLEAYSFQRGSMQPKVQEEMREKMEREKADLLAKGLSEISDEIIALYKRFREQILIDEQDNMHPTAVKTHTLAVDDERSKLLISILRQE